jgi:tetratricopeptide (TPR) repeat protein
VNDRGQSVPGGPRPQIVQNVYAFGGFAYGTINADIHVHGDGRPVYLLEEPKPASGHAHPAWIEQPSRLLNARNAVVPFTGREAELRDLDSWRGDGSGADLAVRLLHGPAGRGKTRLADHFAGVSARQGWKTLVVRHGGVAIPESQGSHDAGAEECRGLLILVDYADRWPLQHLTWLFANSLFASARVWQVPVRVLLLARTTDAWPVLESVLDDRATTSDRELEALSEDPQIREEVFAAARASFCALYDRPDAGAVTPPINLADPGFGLTLSLHVAALVAVDAHVHGRRPPEDMPGLSVYLLKREREHWTRLYENSASGLDFTTPPAEMASLVFVAALTGASRWEDAAAALKSTQVATTPETIQRLLRDHARCYPSPDPQALLEPLYPDRLAEDFLALAVPGHGVRSYRADPWATGAAIALLTSPEASIFVPRAVTILAAAADRWPHLGEAVLYPLLQAHPDLAVDAGSSVLAAIAGNEGIDLTLLHTIEDALEARAGAHRHIGLDAGFASIAKRLAELASPGATDAERARLYSAASVRLRYAGRWAEAVEFSRMALHHGSRRDRAAPDDDAFYPAGQDYARILRQAGRGPEASSWALDTINRLKVLAEVNPKYMCDLAVASVDHAELLRESGGRADAVEHAQRAAEIYCELAAKDPGSHRDELAASLITLAGALAEAGRHSEALGFSAYALLLYEELAASNANAYLPALAAALDDHACRLAVAKRHEESLALTSRAVRILEELARSAPDAHRARLASSLVNHAEQLAAAGRDSEALVLTTRAVQMLAELAPDAPDAQRRELGKALRGHARMLWNAGQQTQAMECAQRAVNLCTDLARGYLRSDKPSLLLSGHYETVLSYARTSASDLARTLSDHANLLAMAGYRPEALHSSRRAVEHCDRLHAEEPDTYLPDLAEGQAVFARTRVLLDTGLDEAALAARSAFRAFEELAIREPEAFTSRLLNAGRTLSDALQALGRTSETQELRRDLVRRPEANHDIGLPATEQAPEDLRIAILKTKRLTARLSGDRVPEGRSWIDIGLTPTEAERQERSEAATRKRISRREEIAALVKLGLSLSEKDRLEESIDACKQAIAIAREIGESSLWRETASALFTLGIGYAKTGQFEECIASYQEAADIYRRLNDQGGEGGALGNLGRALMDAGRFRESIDALQRAATLLSTDSRYRLNEGIALEDMGLALYEIGRDAEAIEALKQAVAVFEEIGNRLCVGAALKNLGHVLAIAGRFEDAARECQQAAAALHEAGDLLREGAALFDLSRALFETGQKDAAVTALQAVAIFQQIGDQAWENEARRLLKKITRG